MQETILSIDLGGTKILVGEVTRTGEILSSKKYPSTVASQRLATEKIKEAVKDYLTEHTLHGQVLGIAICVVGRVDTEKGIWIEIHPGLSEAIALSKEMMAAFSLPCWITNDVTGAALAEKHLGIGRNIADFLYLNIGTGIAGRVISEGQLIKGGSFNAGEVGHMVVDIHSEDVCACGRTGCVELFASGLGMHNQTLKLAKDYPNTVLAIQKNQRVTFQELIVAYEKEDELAKKVVNQALQAAAALTMNLIRVSDPKAVIFGGGVMNDGWFLSHLVTLLNPKTIRFVEKGFKVTTLDPNTIALKGAATLAFIKKGEQVNG
ncbi:glucokinase [Enterococcus sp. AZ194]|uniref:ROK family protein n=1 Tax=Enterococcus sp. AZ194 TaxID=2774629 RepID=UPI003F1ED6C9